MCYTVNEFDYFIQSLIQRKRLTNKLSLDWFIHVAQEDLFRFSLNIDYSLYRVKYVLRRVEGDAPIARLFGLDRMGQDICWLLSRWERERERYYSIIVRQF